MRRSILVFVTAGVALAVFASPVRACDFCLISQGISPLETLSGSGLRLTQRYALNDSVYRGTEEIDNPGGRESFWTTDLSLFHSVEQVPGLLLTANVPLRHTELDGHVHAHGDGEVEAHDDRGEETGIGDVSLLARYTFLTHHTLDSTLLLAGTVGVKLPTGATDGKVDGSDEFMDAHTQLGTGSTDLLLGASANLARGRFGVAANLLSGITGEGEVGDVDHSFGNWLNYDLTGRYRVWPATVGAGGNSVFLSLGANGELRGRETEGGVELEDSGGHTVYVSPGLQVNVEQNWVFEFSYQHAVYHDLNGVQLGEDYKVFGSLTYLF
jgi:hypothetical protein